MAPLTLTGFTIMFRATLALSIVGAFFLTLLAGGLASAAADDSESCFRESGDVAIAACGRVIDTRRSTRGQRINAYASRGQEWYVRHDYDKAIKDFDRAIDMTPKEALEYGEGSVLAYGNRGNAYSAKNDSKNAIASYTAAIAIDPKYPAGYTGRGLEYEKLGNIDKARADFKAALDLQPKYQDGQWALDKAREHLSALDNK
jgi:tetratricopeptide (TPR) repeat protein